MERGKKEWETHFLIDLVMLFKQPFFK